MNRRFLFFSLLLSLQVSVTAQQTVTDSLIAALHTAKEDTNKVMLYKKLAVTLGFTVPEKAIGYGKAGAALAKELHYDYGISANCMAIASGYIYADKLDSALLFLDTTLQAAHRANALRQLGLAYLNYADVFRQKQDFRRAMLYCDSSLVYADKANDDDLRARVNQTIGSMHYQQESYDQCIPFYKKALTQYRKIGNLRMTSTMLNNLSLVYKRIKDFPRSIEMVSESIHIIDSLHDLTNRAAFTGNLSDVYFEMGDYTRAEKYADTSLLFALKQNNEKLMAIAWNFQGSVYNKQKRYPEAIAVLEKALAVFAELDATDRIFACAELLAEVYSMQGNYQKAYINMRIAKTANDSLVKWRYDDDIVAMQTRFQVKEKDNEIELLAKDRELQQQKLRQKNVYILAAVAIALLALFGVWVAINRYRLRQRMKELELRNQIAADLHDEVGSSLSSIHMLSQMANVQQAGDSQKNILDQVSTNARETMERMSDIVWMIKPGDSQVGSLQQRMERFAGEICSGKNIELQMNLSAIDHDRFTMEQRKNIYLVFKEAINNAVKYSGTQRVVVSASQINKQLRLIVQDFGNGFDTSLSGRGNGLDNMKNRAKDLGGELAVESNMGMGTRILLTVPL